MGGEVWSDKEWTQNKAHKDQRYSDNSKYLKHKTSPALAVEIIKNFGSDPELQQIVTESSKHMSFPHENIQRLQNQLATSKQDACSKVFKLQMLYEYNYAHLEDLIKTKKLQNFDDSFDVKAIYNILGSIVNGLLHKKNVWGESDGDIRPYNAFITANNAVKLPDYLSQAQNMTAYQQLLSNLRNDPNLSPELYAQLCRKDPQPISDQEKDDVYALGLLGVQSALLNLDLGIYDPNQGTVNQDLVNAHLEKVYEKYNQDLAKLLYEMLAMDPTERPNLEQIQSQIVTNIANLDAIPSVTAAGAPTLMSVAPTSAPQQPAPVAMAASQPVPTAFMTSAPPMLSATTAGSIDDLSKKIALILEKSRQTVLQYGGAEGIRAYQQAIPDIMGKDMTMNVPNTITPSAYGTQPQVNYTFTSQNTDPTGQNQMIYESYKSQTSNQWDTNTTTPVAYY